jgi:hypothetical protein
MGWPADAPAAASEQADGSQTAESEEWEMNVIPLRAALSTAITVLALCAPLSPALTSAPSNAFANLGIEGSALIRS